jgi:hypothetical protein
MAEKSIGETAFEFFNNLFLERDPRNSILDPMTCIIRLGILSFRQRGTKISVTNNSIKYNNPNIFQGAKRWSMGDNREDLHNIYNPIKKVISWFNLNAKEIRGILEFSISGIKLLKSSYNSNSIVSHTLNLYIRELEQALENSVNDTQRGIKYSNTPRTRSKNKRSGGGGSGGTKDADSEETNANDNTGTTESLTLSGNFFKEIDEIEDELKNKQIFDFFRNLWNENEIVICYNLLLEMSKCTESNSLEELENYIVSLDAILSMKEQKVKNLLTEAATILE